MNDKYLIELDKKINNLKDNKYISNRKSFAVVSSVFATLITLASSVGYTAILKYIVLLAYYSSIFYTVNKDKEIENNYNNNIKKRINSLEQRKRYEIDKNNGNELEKRINNCERVINKNNKELNRNFHNMILFGFVSLIGTALTSISNIALISTFIGSMLFVSYAKEYTKLKKSTDNIESLKDHFIDELDIINKGVITNSNTNELSNRMVNEIERVNYTDVLGKRLIKKI